MIIDNFMKNMENEILKMRKKSTDIMNEFKIQMLQARKRIQKQYPEQQQNKATISNLSGIHQNKTIQTDNKHIINTTNYNSRATNNNMSIQSKQQNKQNQNPNFLRTDVSIVQEGHLLRQDKQTSNKNQINEFNFIDEPSIHINTQDIRRKYQKFISPSGGWTVSAEQLNKEALHDKNHPQFHPFCTEFGLHQVNSSEQQEQQNINQNSFTSQQNKSSQYQQKTREFGFNKKDMQQISFLNEGPFHKI